mmetsp:Transcript_4356/g.13588  ORF Transcript_4356/g.13588 Transcript_4356/m.13588 type:complete len:213 (+) Transcript_4356:336-974(+)
MVLLLRNATDDQPHFSRLVARRERQTLQGLCLRVAERGRRSRRCQRLASAYRDRPDGSRRDRRSNRPISRLWDSRHRSECRQEAVPTARVQWQGPPDQHSPESFAKTLRRRRPLRVALAPLRHRRRPLDTQPHFPHHPSPLLFPTTLLDDVVYVEEAVFFFFSAEGRRRRRKARRRPGWWCCCEESQDRKKRGRHRSRRRRRRRHRGLPRGV